MSYDRAWLTEKNVKVIIHTEVLLYAPQSILCVHKF